MTVELGQSARTIERVAPLPKVTWALACIALVTAILYWRRPDAFYNPQLWAEDGSFFFTEAFLRGLALTGRPYAGYHHLMAQIVAYLGTLLPPEYFSRSCLLSLWSIKNPVFCPVVQSILNL